MQELDIEMFVRKIDLKLNSRVVKSVEVTKPSQRTMFSWIFARTPFGNCYHSRNEKTFLLIEGLIRQLVIEEVRTQRRLVRMNLREPGTVIHVPTGFAYAMTCEPDVRFTILSSEDSETDDTIPHPLITSFGDIIYSAKQLASRAN